MREIKFRAWDLDKKQWYCMEIFRGGHCGPTHRDKEPFYFQPKFSRNVVLQQFTGLKDKHGKEIYERDIIRARWHDSIDAGPGMVKEYDEERVFEVKWEKSYFGYNVVDYPIDDDSTFEIIGNIYENPELLK